MALRIDIRVGESVRIGDAVVTLEEKSGKLARLSVQADKSVPIARVQQSGFTKMVAEHGITAKR